MDAHEAVWIHHNLATMRRLRYCLHPLQHLTQVLLALSDGVHTHSRRSPCCDGHAHTQPAKQQLWGHLLMNQELRGQLKEMGRVLG